MYLDLITVLAGSFREDTIALLAGKAFVNAKPAVI